MSPITSSMDIPGGFSSSNHNLTHGTVVSDNEEPQFPPLHFSRVDAITAYALGRLHNKSKAAKWPETTGAEPVLISTSAGEIVAAISSPMMDALDMGALIYSFTAQLLVSLPCVGVHSRLFTRYQRGRAIQR
jgi:hypothetical protein